MWRQKCLGTELARITSEPLLFSKAQATPKQTWQFVLDMEHLAINSILQRGSSLKQAFALKELQPLSWGLKW